MRVLLTYLLLTLTASPATDKPTPQPWVRLESPAPEQVVPNPVTFEFSTSPGIARVALFVDELPIQVSPFDPAAGLYTHEFRGINTVRRATLEGYDARGRLVASDALQFVPADGFLMPPAGFNRYVIDTLNDVIRFPRDGRFPYCWRDCPGSMGLIHEASYTGESLWRGEGSCFCTGHTLEIFLEAVRRWQAFSGLDEKTPLGALSVDELAGGLFYQHWQGYGVAGEASAADAFEAAAVGYNIYPDSWDTVQPGDFVNLSRDNGTGHAVIFIAWVIQDGIIVGLRYYGCNRRGDSHPDPDDPANRRVSGPSFNSARFVEFGGHVLPEFLFIGHVVDPVLGF